ncbi:hypothetical protein F4703DRAFT_1831405 [Phycomyces blakesleeanus]
MYIYIYYSNSQLHAKRITMVFFSSTKSLVYSFFTRLIICQYILYHATLFSPPPFRSLSFFHMYYSSLYIYIYLCMYMYMYIL